MLRLERRQLKLRAAFQQRTLLLRDLLLLIFLRGDETGEESVVEVGSDAEACTDPDEEPTTGCCDVPTDCKAAAADSAADPPLLTDLPPLGPLLALGGGLLEPSSDSSESSRIAS